MGYDLGLKTKTIGGQLNIFDSEQIRWIRGAVTIDAATVTADGNGKKTLKLGQPLGKITATGKYGPYDSAAVDGRATAVLMLGEDIDCTEGDVVTTAFDQARVIESRLPVAVDGTVKGQLKGITFV